MEKNKKQDYLTKTLILQFVFCALIFAFIYVADYLDIPAISLFRDEIFSELNKDTTKEDVKEAFKKIESFAENEFLFNDFVEEEFNVKIWGEGGEDEKINGENVSCEEYKLNYKIFKPVINGVVSSEFGERVHPITDEFGIHKGLDLALDAGSPIFAIYDGEVVEAEYNQWNGYYVKIKHDNEIMSVYCHCKKLFVKKGDIIRGGEVIASVGSTGQSTGPHLHFELRINDVCYNPEFAFKDAIDAV